MRVVARGAELLGDVPRDRLALAIGVGREEHALDAAGGALDLGEDLRLPLDDVVLRREARLDVHADLGLRQVLHVTDRRAHVVASDRGTS